MSPNNSESYSDGQHNPLYVTATIWRASTQAAGMSGVCFSARDKTPGGVFPLSVSDKRPFRQLRAVILVKFLGALSPDDKSPRKGGVLAPELACTEGGRSGAKFL